jgi:uncharacterized protein YqgV (UPF0045/DUF77 family)
MSTIFAAIERIHATLHGDDAPRITTTIAIHTRANEDVSIERPQ